MINSIIFCHHKKVNTHAHVFSLVYLILIDLCGLIIE